MATKDFFEKYQAESDRVNEVEPRTKIKEPTVGEILHGSDKENLFALYLEQEGQADLRDRLLAGGDTVDRQLMADAAKYRRGFLELMDRAKDLEDRFGDDMEALVAGNADLEDIANNVGVKGMRDAVKNRLKEMVIFDRGRFEQLHNQHLAASDTKKEMEDEQKRIKELCIKYGFTEDQYITALNSDNAPAAVRKLIGWKGGLGRLRRGGPSDSDIEAMGKKDVIEDHIGQYNEDLRDIADSLACAFYGNETLNRSLAAVRQGKPLEKAPEEISFKEVEDVLGANPFDEVEAQEEWARYEDLHKNDAGYNRDSAIDSFTQEHYGNKYGSKLPKKKKGWWSLGFESLIFKGIQGAVA